MARARRALILGCAGGIGATLVQLLARHPAGRRLAARLEHLVLLDALPAGDPPLPAHVLPPSRIEDAEELAPLLATHGIDQVIEVGDVDTLAMSRVCSAHGADYVSASLQRRDVPSDSAESLTMVASRVLIPEQRPHVGATSHLLAAGMNPGIVNALVAVGLEELAQRVGVAPTVEALEVYAIYVTEQDTTTAVEGVEGDVFPMSWSPRHALDEILEPSAMYVAEARLRTLPHRPDERLYLARCGEREVAAMIVPHEEVVTIGARYPAIECAFFYAIPAAAMAALRAHPRRAPEEWCLYRMYPPHHVSPLVGSDRVGVLIASRRHGELWIGFETRVADGARYGTNATLLQAATGVLAGWALLGSVPGVHVVDDLAPRAYLAIVEEILGPPRIVHAPGAPVRSIRDRVYVEEPVTAASRSRPTRSHR
jgi:saccharopine dehydrogenase-like NADP-dependent oxidoreductase